ncbi:CheR family methyltransferase [Parvularcula sp. LCG005]|uniref:CheR family methyltransferase n=1 Tax=Parvularcula sp. LCG005 TaxID=3078805 RepID=UPI002943CDA7|nr:CheR family methyltransferase [Parvularcula sp. LCG005]WOI53017.1 CheR family methyltransferase [Parvularcula sp. LCG005]
MDKQVGDFPIVGIGASAGGLEALNELVKAIPERSGLCYVIIQHLSAEHPSIMDQLLRKHSSIPVQKIEDGMQAKPDTVFVIPGGPSLSIEGNRFVLHDRVTDGGLRTPIDEFFSSLANRNGPACFGVILSGTGTDGTLGIRQIKSAGGFAIVQKSETARFPGMPDSAAATGLIDFTLAPAAIPGRILEIVAHREQLTTDGGGSDRFRADIELALPDILGLIDRSNGHDFSQYKTGTLIRRIERRLTLVRDRSVQLFVERLRDSEEERTVLLQDFLIGVTQFFRDEDAFETLKQDALLPLLNRDQSRFRIWVPGCSTGEEAYSIGMMVHEILEANDDPRPFQIFGTDIDMAALSHARRGHYTESQISGLSAARRERYLIADQDQFQIAPVLRESCVFAPHNLLQDPPFSRLDLVSCRNLLIYLSSSIQNVIIPRFHYALNKKGFLFLGSSESLGKQDRYFTTVDRESRLFQRNDGEEPGYSSLMSTRSDHQRRERRVPSAYTLPSRAVSGTPDFEQQVLTFFARTSGAPFAVVNSVDEVTFLSERMGKFVEPAMGVLSASLDQFLVRALRLPVRSAVAEARSTRELTIERNIVVQSGTTTDLVDVEARPVPFIDGAVMVTLQPVRSQDLTEFSASSDDRDRAERDMIERELTVMRQQLSRTLTDYEATEQELKSSNEELLSMNEELQSSNEELETSREELQSINEELETINAELSENNRQLVEANSDLRNLFESTDIATVFLDNNLCVRRYTPASRRLFGIQDRDIGRPINDLKWKVSYDDLEADAAQVTQTLQPIEREARIDATEETFLMRIRPYRRTDDRLDGCIITFVDITGLKKVEKQLQQNADTLSRQYAELESLYDMTPVGLNLLDRDLRYLRINERLAAINGFPVKDHIGKRQDELVPDIDEKVRATQLEVLRTGTASLGNEVEGTTPADPHEKRYWLVDYYPVVKDGVAIAVGCCVTDVTEQKRLQQAVERGISALAESEKKLRRIFDEAPVYIALHEGSEHRYLYANSALKELIGEPNIEGKALRDVLPLVSDVQQHAHFDSVLTTGEAVQLPDLRITVRPDDGETRDDRWYSVTLQPWFGPDGKPEGVMSFSFDVTEQVLARKTIEASELRLNFALEASRLGVWELDLTTKTAQRTARHDSIFGYQSPLDRWTADQFVEHVLPDDREAVQQGLAIAIENGVDWQFQCQIRRADCAIRWIEGHGRPQMDESGRPVRILGTVVDITERKLAEENQTLLLHELQHRVKNTMATTLAIVQFSAKRATDVASFSKTLRNRLSAISRTHDLLTKGNWEGAYLRAVFDTELSAYTGGPNHRARYEGEDVYLDAKQMLSLTLGLHELATNAAKYGALSSDEGTVVFTVRTDEDRMVHLTWEEMGGPTVTPPQDGASGFGSFLLNRVLGSDLKGTTEVEYRPEGLRCQIHFPLAQ